MRIYSPAVRMTKVLQAGLTIACAVALVVVVAGCAVKMPGVTEAPGQTVAPTSTAVPSPPTPTESPVTTAPMRVVKIGVLNPTTGALAAFGEWVNSGIELYFDSIDYAVEGASIELVFADTAGDPQQGLEQARRLVEQEGVDLLMGTVNSAVVVPLAQFAGEAEVPFIITVGGATAATGPDSSPFVFRTGMANGQQDRPLGWYTASELGLTRGALFVWDFLVGEERGGAFASGFTEAGGTIVTEQRPPLGTPDYGPYISQLDPTNTDVVYAFFAGPGAIAFVQQMSEFGLLPDLQLVGCDYLTVGVLQAMGDPAEGIVQGMQYAPVLDNPENQAFLALYEAEIGGEPNIYVEEGFLGGLVVATAIEAVGGDLSDMQRFLDALATLEVNGPSGPLRFDEHGQSIRNVYITRVVRANDGSLTYEVLDVIEGVSQGWTP